MSHVMLTLVFALLLFLIIPQNSDGRSENLWCIADTQASDDVLEGVVRWVCKEGGVDCTDIQKGKPCYFPNTWKAHASYVFNKYYQKFKNQGAFCFFNGAGLIEVLDPSHGLCKFELLP